jgi:hypothetical protein
MIHVARPRSSASAGPKETERTRSSPPTARRRGLGSPGGLTLRPNTAAWALAQLVGMSALGCDGAPPLKHPPAQFSHSDWVTETTEGRDRVSDERLAIPTDLLIVDGALVVADLASEHRLLLFDAVTGDYIRSFGGRGRGPGEFRASPYLFPPVQGDRREFWAFDPGQSRFTRYEYVDEGWRSEPTQMSVQLQAERVLYEAFLVDDSTWLGLGFLDSGRLASGRLGSTGLTQIGEPLSSFVEREEDEGLLQQFYKAKLYFRPGTRDRVVLATIRGSLFEILRADGGRVWRGHGPIRFDPDFVLDTRTGRPVWRAGEANRYGFLDVTATAQCIYALFSGRSEEGFRGDAWLGEFLYVFDWEGNLKGVQRFDRPGLSIAVDEARGEVLVATFELDPRITAYELAVECDQ